MFFRTNYRSIFDFKSDILIIKDGFKHLDID